MPIYFSDVAPVCPISTDQSTGPRQAHLFNRPVFVRPTIPRVPSNANLNDVIQIANITRNIVQSVSHTTVRNNVFDPNTGKGSLSAAKDKFKNTTARWVEQKDKRIRRRYKYFAKDDSGSEDKDTYITMERIERMVWYDRGWKAFMTWEYGDKGEGEPVGGGGGES
jgi:hypothetical protein